MPDNSKEKKLAGILVKQNIGLIILFILSTLLLSCASFGSLPLLYQIFICNEEIKSLVFPVSEIVKFGIAGVFIGTGLSIYGLIHFSIATIVNLIRLFIIIFIILLSVLYISLRVI